MTPHGRQLARAKAQIARHLLSRQIGASNLPPLEQHAMREALSDLWQCAVDAWTVDEGGPVYPHLQTGSGER
jgi:hypothetical protein